MNEPQQDKAPIDREKELSKYIQTRDKNIEQSKWKEAQLNNLLALNLEPTDINLIKTGILISNELKDYSYSLQLSKLLLFLIQEDNEQTTDYTDNVKVLEQLIKKLDQQLTKEQKIKQQERKSFGQLYG